MTFPEEPGTVYRGNSIPIPFYVPILNPIMKTMLRIGVPMGNLALITVKGRRTGRPRTTAVAILESEGRRFMFGTFGEVDWTKNLRASGRVVVGRGRKPMLARELGAEEKAEVLKRGLAPFLASRMGSTMLRMGYGVKRDSSMHEYLIEARRHPGFELEEAK